MVQAAILINAVLWSLGGAGAWPFGRNWRRVGYPVLVLVIALQSGLSDVMAVLLAILCHLSTRLPLTFFGSTIPGHWFNWIWLWLGGYIIGLPAVLTHGWWGLAYALLPAFAQGLSVTLSNLPGSASAWPHEACEVFIGAAVFLALF